jgi:hypothetical protein
MTAKYGGVFLPIGDKVHKVTFSDQSPTQSEQGKHYKSFSAAEQRVIRKHVESRGFTVEELSADYTKRDEFNILFFLELERTWVDQPFKRTATQPQFIF